MKNNGKKTTKTPNAAFYKTPARAHKISPIRAVFFGREMVLYLLIRYELKMKQKKVDKNDYLGYNEYVIGFLLSQAKLYDNDNSHFDKFLVAYIIAKKGQSNTIMQLWPFFVVKNKERGQKHERENIQPGQRWRSAS